LIFKCFSDRRLDFLFHAIFEAELLLFVVPAWGWVLGPPSLEISFPDFTLLEGRCVFLHWAVIVAHVAAFPFRCIAA